MSKEKQVQSIESLKLNALKVSHRYQLGLTALVFTVVGVIGGYFLSINVISDAQAKVVNSIELVSKTEQ